MYKLKELTEQDVVNHQLAIRCAYQVYEDVVGVFYLVEKDGKEYILHNCDNVFMLIEEYDDETVSYTMFGVDNNFELCDLGYKDFELHIMDDEYVFQDRKTGISSSIILRTRDNGEDIDGYNGFVRYTQFNPERKTRATITFQHMFYGEGKISRYHIVKPFQFIFYDVKQKRNGEFKINFKDQFIGRTFNYHKEKMLYDIATIKDYGLSEFLEKGSYSLQKRERDVTRYYKILWVNDNQYAKTGFPFTRQYTLEDMKAKLDECGFSYEIPQIYIDIYNGNDSEMNDIKLLIDEIKKNVVFVDEPYVLEMGGKDAN